MSNQVPQLADRVLRVIYDLQFRGRTQALAKRLVKDGPKVYVPAGADRMPFRFESVPILALLAEFYEPGLDYMSHPVTDLRATIRYCERQGWIEPYLVEGGEAEVNHGSVREVESAIGIYFRPDGVLVTSFWFLAEVDCIPPVYRALNPKQLREELQIGDMRHLHLSGICVGPDPIYWAFRRLNKLPMGPDLVGPTLRLTLGYPAGLSGYPSDLNYVITKEGIARIESGGVDDRETTPRGAATPGDGHGKPLSLFISYSHEDERFRDELRRALTAYEREGELAAWDDTKIVPGQKWEKEILENLEQGDIIVLLLSNDFIHSDYCTQNEMKRALARDAAGECAIVPIVVRACAFKKLELGKIQAIQPNGKPINENKHRDAAWLEVTKQIERVIAKLKVCQEVSNASNIE